MFTGMTWLLSECSVRVDIMFAGHMTSTILSLIELFLIFSRVGWELPFLQILTRLRLWVLTRCSSFCPMVLERNIYSVYILNKIYSITLNLQILAKLVTGVSIPVTCKIRILPSVISENRVVFSFIVTVGHTNFIVLCGLSWRIPSVLFRGLRRLALQPSLSMAGKFLLS